MKPFLSTISLLIAVVGVLSLSNCAGVVTPYEQSVLVEAGFQPVLPETVTERNAYAALPAYKLSPTDAPGKPAYVYRNESEKVTYIGGTAEYRRYQELIQKKGTERSERLVAQTSQDSMHMFR